MPPLEGIVCPPLGTLSMKTIRSYSMQFEADLARIALEGADISAVVVGVGMGMEGGIGGVQLLVPEDRIDAALKVLEEFEGQDEHPEYINGHCRGLGERLGRDHPVVDRLCRPKTATAHPNCISGKRTVKMHRADIWGTDG